LTISVQASERLSLEQIQAFLEGSGEVGFKGQNREEVYGWVNQTLRQKRYGVKLKRSGKELRGRCPIHQGDGTESFHANTDKNAFHCFSCQAKGNVLDFVAAVEKCSVRDAALKLQGWFQITAIEGPPTVAQKSPTASQPAKEEAGERGEPNKPLAFRLKGIDHHHPYLAQRGIDPETAEYFGAGFFSGKGSMSWRIVIPIENEAGELVAYAGRSIDGSEPKYKLPAGFKKSHVLFNLCRGFGRDRWSRGTGRGIL
jgi:DNA primase